MRGVVRSRWVLSVVLERWFLSEVSARIEHMIEVRELDAGGTLAEAAATLAEQLRLDARQLELAAHWADLHHPDSLPPPLDTWEERRRRLDGDYGVHPGGEGTAPILASRPAELGLVLRTSAGGAKHLIADALDLRHRLPSLWAEVQDGQVRAWQARRVAQATRHLPLTVMGQVDAGLAGLMPTLPWSRFEAILDATVQRADPLGARLAEAEASSRRFVALGRDDGHGLKTLIARGEVLDILTFLAAVNRIADLLEADGDIDTVEVRRSKAVGILGQPDRALALLSAHRYDLDQHVAPTEPRRHGSWRRTTAHDDGDADGPEESEPAPADDPGTSDERPAPRDEDEPDDPPLPEPDQESERSLELTLPPRAVRPASPIRIQLYVHLTDAALRGDDPGAVCRRRRRTRHRSHGPGLAPTS